MRKACEPPMTPEVRRQLGDVLERLGKCAEIERTARAQVDKLTREAWQLGATDHTIAKALRIKLDAARMRRRRLGQTARTRKRRDA